MRHVLSVAAMLGLFALAGCGEPSSENDKSAAKTKNVQNDPLASPAETTIEGPVIGVSVLTMTNPFFVDLADAIKAEGRKHNFQVIVTAGELDVANQMRQVNEFIVKQVDAIVLCPCDSKAIGTSISAANDAGIPVFTADIACLAEGPEVVCHVATDNYGGGILAGQTMVELLGGTGTVAIIDYPEVESVILRTKGFREIIEKTPGVEIVGAWPGSGDRVTSSKTAAAVLQQFPDLDGFFAINDPSGVGVAVALKEAGKADRIEIIAFDAQPMGREAVSDGRFHATIVQYPRRIGATVIDAMARYFKAEEVKPEILIPCSAYLKADAERDPTLVDADP